MSLTPPLCSYGVVTLKSGRSVDLNKKSAYDLIKNNFSLSFYIRLKSSAGETQQLMQVQQGCLTLQLNGTTIEALFQNWQTVSSQVELEINQWYCITLTMDVGRKEATFFVDGSPFGSTDPAAGFTPYSLQDYTPSDNGTYPYIGDQVHADFLNVCFFKQVLTPTEVIQNNYERPPAELLHAYYDFSSLDPKGCNLNNASLSLKTPSNLFTNGMAVPIRPDSDVNPAGDITKPFTVQCWVRTNQPVRTQSGYLYNVIFANGGLDQNKGFALALQYDDTLSKFVMSVRLPGYQNAVLDTTKLSTNKWYNLTMTWDGGRVSFYINGSHSSGKDVDGISNTPIDTPNLAIAGAPLDEEGVGYGYFYLGNLQSLGVWDRLLGSDEIASFEAPLVSTQHGCVAFYDMTTEDIVNNVSAVHYGRIGTVVLKEHTYSDSTPVAAREQLTAGEEDARDYVNLSKLQAGEARFGQGLVDLTAPLTSSRLSSEHLSRFERDIENALADVPEHLRAQMDARLNNNLRLGLSQLEHAQRPVPGSVTNHRQGDDMVWLMHTVDGEIEVYREKADTLTPCQQWGLSASITGVSIFMSVFGIKFSASSLAKQLRKVMLQRNSALARALAKVENGHVSGEFIMDMVFYMVTDGTFKKVLTECIRDVSWWELSLVVVSIVSKIGLMFASGGWYLAFILAEVTLNIAAFVMVVEEGTRLGCIPTRVEQEPCPQCSL